MNLLAIRTKFVEVSGRFDLVVDRTDYADQGADFFIKAGQGYLQSIILGPKSEAQINRRLANGGNSVTFSDCQSIYNVWLRPRTLITSGTLTDGEYYEITAVSLLDFTDDGAATNTVGTRFTATSETLTMTAADNVIKLSYELTEESFELTKIDRKSIINNSVPSGVLNTTDLPQYFAIDVIRNAEIEGTELLRGLLFGAAANQEYAIVIDGIFRPKELSVDADINYWTENYPEILLYAAFYSMETFYRNTQGANDWNNAILKSVRGIDEDIVQEEQHEVTQIQG